MSKYLLTFVYFSYTTGEMKAMEETKESKKSTVVIPVRLPADLHTRVKNAARNARATNSWVMTQSIENGISTVEAMFPVPKPAKKAKAQQLAQAA